MDFVNNKDNFPDVRNWMYGIYESGILSISTEKSTGLLVDISDLALPKDVKIICRISNNPYLYYINQAYSNRLYYQELNLDDKGGDV